MGVVNPPICFFLMAFRFSVLGLCGCLGHGPYTVSHNYSDLNKKYLSKRSLIKHTCSWRDRLIVLWTLNRQAKIFLRILNISLSHHFPFFKTTINGYMQLKVTVSEVLVSVVKEMCISYFCVTSKNLMLHEHTLYFL